jgi:hypothetical protein
MGVIDSETTQIGRMQTGLGRAAQRTVSPARALLILQLQVALTIIFFGRSESFGYRRIGRGEITHKTFGRDPTERRQKPRFGSIRALKRRWSQTA